MSRLLRGACAALLITGLLHGCSGAQSRKASYIVHGKKFLASGNYLKARVEFSNAAQIDPTDVEARLMLGEVAEKLGDARGALAQYLAAVAADPRAIKPRAALARLYLYGGLPAKAIELIAPALVAAPDSPQLLTVRGAARQQLGDAAGALADAQRAIALAPEDLYAIGLLASVYKAQAQIAKAIAVIGGGLARYPDNPDLHAMLAELEQANQEPAKAEVELRRIVALEPDVLSHRYRLAQFYLQRRDAAGAERTLREAVHSHPESVEAKWQLVECLAQQAGTGPAVEQVDRFLAAEPDNDPLRLTLGQFLVLNKQPQAAERSFRAVIAHAGDGPDGLAARDRLAELLIERQDIPGASELIAQVLSRNVRDNDALILRSRIGLAQGQTQAAITDLRAVLRDQPNAVALMRTLAQAYRQNGELDLAEQTLRAAVQISPGDSPTRLELARTLISAAKLDEAATLLGQLIAEDPTARSVRQLAFSLQMAQRRYDQAQGTARDLQLAMPQQGLGFYLAGLVDEVQGRPDEAEVDYEQALQRQPDAAEPLAALVRLDVGRKRGAAALARVDAVIAGAPRNAVARNLKGEVLLGQGQTDAALAAYRQSVEVAPGWDQGYQGLARAQSAAGHLEDARRTLEDGIRGTHGSTLLIAELGSLYERLGRSADAIALYEGVLRNTPGSAMAANNLAMLLVNYRTDPASLARAQDLARQLATSPEVSAIDTRGWVKFKSGDARGAELLLRQAVEREPQDPELRYHLGMAQMRSGERELARQNLASAVASGASFTGREEAGSALARL